MKVQFVLERETKGALLFKEVDAKGKIIESMYDTKIGSLYIRKDSEICLIGPRPTKIEVEVRAL